MAKRKSTSSGATPRTRRKPDVEAEGTAEPIEESQAIEAGEEPLTRAELLAILKSIEPTSEPQPPAKKKGLLVQYWWVLLLLLFGAFLWYQNQGPVPRPEPGPVPTPDAPVDPDLLTLATRSFRTRDAAEAFANACDQIAVMLEADAESQNPSFTKRSQVGETLVAQLCRAVILSKLDVNREDLVEFATAAWIKESEWPQAEGLLSAEDRKKAIKQFKAMARAAYEVQ